MRRDPEFAPNGQALMRRAQASERLDKLEDALRGVWASFHGAGDLRGEYAALRRRHPFAHTYIISRLQEGGGAGAWESRGQEQDPGAGAGVPGADGEAQGGDHECVAIVSRCCLCLSKRAAWR